MQQPYDIASQIRDCITNINIEWWTHEERVSPLNIRMEKEQIDKE